jgi:hypothetical protein
LPDCSYCCSWVSLFVPVKCHQHRVGVEYHRDAQTVYLCGCLVAAGHIGKYCTGREAQWGRPTSDKEPRLDGQLCILIHNLDVQHKDYVVCSDNKVKSKRHEMRFLVTFVTANQHCMWRNASENVILWSNICHRHLQILCALITCR